jgi:hypothetical protein
VQLAARAGRGLEAQLVEHALHGDLSAETVEVDSGHEESSFVAGASVLDFVGEASGAAS